MLKKYLAITNKHVRASVEKYLFLGADSAEGTLSVSLSHGYSQYNREHVEQIIEACQKFLEDLKTWHCRFCASINETVPHDLNDPYPKNQWARCPSCKKKTKLVDLPWGNPPLIWWTSQQDCELIDEFPKKFPLYIKDEYDSRYGRAGRGRLWASSEFGAVSVDPWPDFDLAKNLAANHGGIVFHTRDLHFLSTLPGIVTDFKLNLIDKS